MDSILKTVEALRSTPIPHLLIILGGVFLLLAFVGKIGGTIEMPPTRQKWAGLVGVLFLILGITLSIATPAKPPSPPVPAVTTPPNPPPIVPTTPVPTTPVPSSPDIIASEDEVTLGLLVYKLRSIPSSL